jgi:WD40 repeat protein
MRLTYFLILVIIVFRTSQSQNPEVILKNGYESTDNILAFSNDDKLMLTTEDDNTARIWNIEKRSLDKILRGSRDKISFATFSKDDKYVIAACDDGAVRKWAIETGIETLSFGNATSTIRYSALSPLGDIFSSYCENGTLDFWETESGRKIQSFKSDKGVCRGIYWLDKRTIMTAFDDRIIVWDVFSKKKLKELQCPIGKISAVFVSIPNGIFVTSGYDSTLSIWSIGSLAIVKTVSVSGHLVSSICISENGQFLLAGTEDGLIIKYSPGDSTENSRFSGHNGRIISLSVSHDTQLFASNSSDRTIKFWNTKDGREVPSLISNKWIISSVVSFDKGRKIAFSSCEGAIRIWDLVTGDGSKSFQIHDLAINNISVSKDNRYVATASNDNTVKVFDLNTEKVIRHFTGHTAPVTSVAFSPDDSFLISTSYDRTIRIWSIYENKEMRKLEGHRGAVNGACYSPDGSTIASVSDDSCMIFWNAREGTFIHKSWGHRIGVKSLCYTPDGKYVYTGGKDKKLLRWDAKSFKLLGELYGHTWVISGVSVSRDSKELLSAGYDQMVCKWNIPTDEQKFGIPSHQNSISSISFSPDMNYYVTGSWDGTLKMWGTGKGELIATLVPIDVNDYLILTPENYYTGSKGGIRSVSFKTKEVVYPYAAFDIMYNRPDKVLGKIGYADPQQISLLRQCFQYRLKKLNLSESIADASWPLPEVEITNKSIINNYSQNRNVTISISAIDRTCRLVRLKVTVNEVPLGNFAGLDIFDANSFSYQGEIPIVLSEGRNLIKVSVVNERGSESIGQYEEVYFKNPDYSKLPSLFVITIGISNYKDSYLNLKYAAKDSKDLAEFFKMQNGRFGSVQAINLTDSLATKQRILLLKKFLGQSDYEDEVLLYVSGQGILDTSYNYYFGTYDVDYLKPSKEGLSLDELESIFDGIKARRRILLVNSNNSGEIDIEAERKLKLLAKQDCQKFIEPEMDGLSICPTPGREVIRKRKTTSLDETITLQSQYFIDLSKGTGAVVISSSSGANEFLVDRDNYYNSVFAYAMMYGLSNLSADFNKDGKITITELKNYVIGTVPGLTYNLEKPTVKKEIIENDFVIW